MYHLECKSRLMKKDRFILGEGRATLLKLIGSTGSISDAAKEMGMSYRHAWGEVKEIEDAMDGEVVKTQRGGEKGGGTELTATGKELLNIYHEMMEEHSAKRYLRPGLTVDGIIVSDDKILLIKRKNPPYQGMYALPGGFVEYGETVEDAVVREIEEETGLKTSVNELISVYSKPDRDPRGHTVSTVFSLNLDDGKIKHGSDASEASYIPLKELPELAFDHSQIIDDYLRLSGDQTVSNAGSL